MNRIAALGCLVLVFLVAPSLAAVVYETDTTTANFFNVAGNGFDALGDQVTLGGTERYVTSVVVPLKALEDYSADLTLTLYLNDGLPSNDGISPEGNPMPGTVIASSSLTGVGFTTNQTQDVTFVFNTPLVPNSFTFALSQDNPGDTGASGLQMLISNTTVVTGSSPDLVWYLVSPDWTDDDTLTGGDDQIRATINAVESIPEPASLAAMLAGGGLILLRRRKA